MKLCNKKSQSRKVTIKLMAFKNQNQSLYQKRNNRKFLYQYGAALLEATGTEKLQEKQNLGYFRISLL